MYITIIFVKYFICQIDNYNLWMVVRFFCVFYNMNYSLKIAKVNVLDTVAVNVLELFLITRFSHMEGEKENI